jgi:hypothetical protein
MYSGPQTRRAGERSIAGLTFPYERALAAIWLIGKQGNSVVCKRRQTAADGGRRRPGVHSRTLVHAGSLACVDGLRLRRSQGCERSSHA